MRLPTCLDSDEIATLIPHQGAMCLLDAIDEWSSEAITARASSHRHCANPLREDDGLPALAAIEYAAQAMAVHGGLLARAQGGHAQPGYLVSVRDVRFGAAYLDRIDADLEIRATRLAADAAGLLYSFSVSGAARSIATGRALVSLDPPEESRSR